MSPMDPREALDKVRAWIEAEEFNGYDPYDALTGWMPFQRFGKWAPVLAIQLQKRSPINLRPLLGIRKSYNPKAIGLLLEAYSLLYRNEGDESAKATADWLFDWLRENTSKGYSGACWGYPFDWASRVKYLPAGTPSAVVTGFVSKGIFEYYTATGDPRAPGMIQSAADFILNDLPRHQTSDGLCFSYTPVMKDCCYNASLLAAEVLAMAYSFSANEALRTHVTQGVDFVVARQKADGRWNYSMDLDTGVERAQIDFHQGFLLDSLLACIKLCNLKDASYGSAVRKGAEFYRKSQFTSDGRAYWRLPKQWPVDIHHLAQGIISFSKMAAFEPLYLDFANAIARWTIDNMFDSRGYFYYRKGWALTNKTAYLRWGQAWMMVALARVLQRSRSATTRLATHDA